MMSPVLLQQPGSTFEALMWDVDQGEQPLGKAEGVPEVLMPWEG